MTDSNPFEWIDWVFADEDLSASTCRIAYRLARAVAEGNASPSLRDLSSNGTCGQTGFRAIRTLRLAGYLKVKSGKRGCTSSYVLKFPLAC